MLVNGKPVQIAWTLIHTSGTDWSTLFGPVNDPRVVNVQLIEKTGDATTVPVSGSRAWFLARPYSGPSIEGVARTYPVVVRALDASGQIIYEEHL